MKYDGRVFTKNKDQYEIRFEQETGKYYFYHDNKKYYLVIDLNPPHPHEAGVYFEGNNKKFITWLAKPSDKKRKREGSKKLIKSLELDPICEICLSEDYDTLEVHHVKEVQNGGTDDKGNLRVYCNTCHTLVHSLRKFRTRIITFNTNTHEG